MPTRLASCLVSLFLSFQAFSQQAPLLDTTQQIDSFMQGYYLHPQPELLPHLVEAVHATGLIQKQTAIPPLVAFFSEAVSATPERIPDIQAVVAKQDDATKAMWDHVMAVRKSGGVLHLEGHSPTLNDMYWGAFSATGNPQFISKLTDQLRLCDDRTNVMLYGTGISAEWSLASVAKRNDLVRSTLTEIQHKSDTDKRTQDLIAELLSVQDPNTIKENAIAVIKQQHAAGKW